LSKNLKPETSSIFMS
jgi:hypothetical protein